MNKETVVGGCVVVAFILLLAVVLGFQKKSDHEAIRQWHTSQGQTVVEIDQPLFASSPWWFMDDDDRIYRAKVRDKTEREKTCWHKFNIFGHDQRWR